MYLSETRRSDAARSPASVPPARGAGTAPDATSGADSGVTGADANPGVRGANHGVQGAATGVSSGTSGAGAEPGGSGAGGGGVPGAGTTGSGATRRALAGNVVALGLVSLFTDVSSEMVTAVLPLYLVYQLALSPMQFGLLDGVYTGATAVLRLAGGHVADRFRRRKLVAGAGYAISAVCKIGYLLAGRSVPLIGLLIGLDRAGKGLRTAPRDAMISLSAPAEAQGRAFGLHRAMDTAGALMGPLAAFGVVAAVGAASGYDAVFVVSGCVAAIGVLILALFVREPGTEREPRAGAASASGAVTAPAPGASGDSGAAGAGRRAVPLRGAVELLRRRPFRRVLVAVLPLSLTTISDSFLYLVLQRTLDIDAGWLPLLPVGVACTYLLAAVPFGRLADRVGRAAVVTGGYLALLACYALLLLPPGPAVLVAVLALRGLSYAATDGVVSALAGPLLPEERRATGLAVVQTGQALGAMAASWAFGVLWAAQGPRTAVVTMTAGLGLALAFAVPQLRKARG
ncbi:MFS transporter [Sphaerisporangium melleum]|uniref:MFS transporter n=1 Tax=Sphaerisporangium melleum TaxID=321316 RepID=A0A917QZV3_9ACTN|nr:MFS transporter [Sphaerisporangium melleum]GGK79565.1 MFS transporter [Sphaerisporangium melleum]GII69683.1 MFS transporter [Sphaerisporangium melleum]